MLPFKLIFHPRLTVDLGDHVFPAQKYRLVHDRLLESGLADQGDFITPRSASDEDVARVHTASYMNKLKSGQLTKPFEIPNPRQGLAKVGVLQVTERIEGGEYSVADMRERIRDQLTQEKQYRRLIDQLRKEQFVLVKM